MTKKNIFWWVLTHHKSENSLSLCFQPYQGKQARQIQLNFKFKSISIMRFRFIASKILIKMFIKSQLLLLSLQSCPTLCDPIDGGPPGSPVPGILQARTLEWVAVSFSNAWKWKVKVKSLSRVRLLERPQGLQPTRLLHPWDFPGKSTGVGCHCLLREEPDLY